MTTVDFMAQQGELQALLRLVGPLLFLRELLQKTGAGAEIIPDGMEPLDGRQVSTRFTFTDRSGRALSFRIVSELNPGAALTYDLVVRPGPGE